MGPFKLLPNTAKANKLARLPKPAPARPTPLLPGRDKKLECNILRLTRIAQGGDNPIKF